MSLHNDLKPIFDRIAQHQQTDADMAMLRQYLSTGGQFVLQQGKYAVNLGQGKDIHAGDRIYQGADATTIQTGRYYHERLIVFAIALLTSTIIPNILISDAAFASIPMFHLSPAELNQCALPELRIADSKALKPSEASGTAKDLQIIGVQKVEKRCFFGFGEGDRTPEFKFQGDTQANPFRLELRYNQQTGRIEVPLFNISF